MSNREKTLGFLFLRMLKWTGLSVLGLIVLLVISGLVFQFIGSRIDTGKYPAPGRMFDLGTHKLHASIGGRGGPTVVLESPVGGSHLGWCLVRPDLEARTTVFAYDRAGYGWSDKGPGPRTANRLTEELWSLLEKSGVPKPYVLVGQSFGGTLVRLLAVKHPEETAALMLIETSHENMFARMPEALEEMRKMKWQLAMFRLLAPLGLMRLMRTPLGEGSMDVLPAELRPAARAVGYRPRWLGAVADEVASMETSFAQVREAVASRGPAPYTDMPVVVLTKGLPSDEKEAVGYDRWLELQKDLVACSRDGEHRVVEGSGHFIQADKPEVIVKSVLGLLNQLR